MSKSDTWHIVFIFSIYVKEVVFLRVLADKLVLKLFWFIYLSRLILLIALLTQNTSRVEVSSCIQFGHLNNYNICQHHITKLKNHLAWVLHSMVRFLSCILKNRTLIFLEYKNEAQVSNWLLKSHNNYKQFKYL